MYLESLAEQTANKVFIRFPSMIGEVLEVVSTVLQRERDKAKRVAEALIESEQGYLFTNDNDYITNRTDIIPVLELRLSNFFFYRYRGLAKSRSLRRRLECRSSSS